MILINLLPEELRPIKRTPLPHLLSIAVLVIAIAGSGFLFAKNFAYTRSLERETVETEAELAKLSAITDEYKELQQLKLDLQDKVTTIQDILSDRKIWSQLLHRLAQLTPENVWYSGIVETKEAIKKIVPKVDEKTGKPKMKKRGGKEEIETETVTVQQPVLQISGYIINDEEGRANIYELSQATTNDPEFSASFEFLRPDFKDTDFNGFNVREFTLVYIIKAGKPEE